MNPAEVPLSKALTFTLREETQQQRSSVVTLVRFR